MELHNSTKALESSYRTWNRCLVWVCICWWL